MVYIVGHRGAPLYEPENTIESFKKAIEFGVDFFECDVHLTRDEEVVIIHDHTLDRTTNSKGYVNDYTLKELKKIIVGGKHKIPTLEEVLKLNFPTVIELKAPNPLGKSYAPGNPNREIYPHLIEKVIELVKDSKLKDIILVSFDRRYLTELNDYPEFKKMLLSRPFPNLDEIRRLNLFGMGIEYPTLNEENVRQMHKNNLKVLAWTVDKKEDMKKMIKLKVDFLASNDPKLALETIRKQE